MTTDQTALFAILTGALILFIWNRWRYDLVAVAALLISVLAGLVEPDMMFSGLGHTAVVTVAAVLVMSRGLLNSGVVDSLARLLARAGKRPWVQVATLTGIVAISSGFMNNVGALALLMPVAVWMARKAERSPSFLLMPIAFGSLLGGTLTMIGTPPNIIIAQYRSEATGSAFRMFDFMPVGLGITLLGLLFIILIGWRLIPGRKKNGEDSGDLFEVEDYTMEVIIDDKCEFAGKTIHELVTTVREDAEILVLAMLRKGRLRDMPSLYTVLRSGDTLVVEGDSESLKTLLDITDLKMEAEGEKRGDLSELTMAEVIIAPGSMLIGTTPGRMALRQRYGLNIIAAARHGQQLRKQLSAIRLLPGDILLVQGDEDTLKENLKILGCLPLASRGLRIGIPGRVLHAGVIFASVMALIALGLVPAAAGLLAGSLIMVLTGLISPGEIYASIDMKVIVLLAAMLPIGQALETTGGSQLIADGLLEVSLSLSPAGVLAVLMVSVMLLSNVVNNAAAAIIAAPVSIRVAQGMGASVDPFLMAVAIGASCAFLTPIGHQSNTLVMEPGGYRFGDYWRMGLPLSILVVAASVPLIMYFWPL